MLRPYELATPSKIFPGRLREPAPGRLLLVPARRGCATTYQRARGLFRAATPRPSRRPARSTGHHQSPPSRPDTSARPRSTPSSRECQGSAELTVKHQPKHRHASPKDEMSSISRAHTFNEWGGRGSNPRPTDYESLDTGRATRRNGPRRHIKSPARQQICPFRYGPGTPPVRQRFALGRRGDAGVSRVVTAFATRAPGDCGTRGLASAVIVLPPRADAPMAASRRRSPSIAARRTR
jgi:hypothetical protein